MTNTQHVSKCPAQRRIIALLPTEAAKAEKAIENCKAWMCGRR